MSYVIGQRGMLPALECPCDARTPLRTRISLGGLGVIPTQHFMPLEHLRRFGGNCKMTHLFYGNFCRCRRYYTHVK